MPRIEDHRANRGCDRPSRAVRVHGVWEHGSKGRESRGESDERSKEEKVTKKKAGRRGAPRRSRRRRRRRRRSERRRVAFNQSPRLKCTPRKCMYIEAACMVRLVFALGGCLEIGAKLVRRTRRGSRCLGLRDARH